MNDFYEYEDYVCLDALEMINDDEYEINENNFDYMEDYANEKE